VHGITRSPSIGPNARGAIEPHAPASGANNPMVFTRDGHRPLWLLPAPVALDVRNGRLYWEGALALEPERERIEGGWWDGADIARDYFIAHGSQGRRFWVFREMHGTQWFLHGLFG
jgi:hypothetical protein